jgi:hypothetical protein
MTGDIILIPKYQTDCENEITQLKTIQAYWNHFVKCVYFWMDLARKKLDASSLKRIHRYLRDRLLIECDTMIKDTEKCKASTFASVTLKKDLLEEYEDRMIYIKKTF